MKKLRLLVTKECDRACPGCCNKDWDLKALPQVTWPSDYKDFDEIILTGGEPLLFPNELISLIKRIRIYNSRCKIFLYTAYTEDVWLFQKVLEYLDGVTLTLHEQDDVDKLYKLDFALSLSGIHKNKSMRLNIFKGIKLTHTPLPQWKIKDNIKWIKNCPLPKDEVFMSL